LQHHNRYQRSKFLWKVSFCFYLIIEIISIDKIHSNAQFIVAGSDDGSFFIWDRNTTNIIKVLKGDDSIVNCLQPHPSTCLLATSGIENTVRLWSPRPEVLKISFTHFEILIMWWLV
jgi:WD40 repeat protein